MASTRPAFAQTAEIVLTDGLIGAGFGAAIAVALASSDGNREEAAHRIPAAAAIGAILGMAAGALEVSGAFARYDAEHKRLALGLPAPRVTWRGGGALLQWSLFEAGF